MLPFLLRTLVLLSLVCPSVAWAQGATGNLPVKARGTASASPVAKSAAQFLRKKLNSEYPRQVDRHAAWVRNRKLSVALSRGEGRLTRLNLEELLPHASRGERSRVHRDLQRVEQGPMATWMSALALTASQLPQGDPHRENLATVWTHVWRTHSDTGEHDPLVEKTQFLDRFTERLLRRERSWVLARSLPENLPPLAAPRDEPVLAPFLERSAKGRPSPGVQFARLERELALLRGAPATKDGRGAEALAKYLERYKEPWTDRWLAERLTRFKGQPPDLGWTLRSDVHYEQGKGAPFTHEERERIRDRLSQAWTIIIQAVHPDILRTLPKVVVMVERERTRASHKNQSIYLAPDSTVKTILHEFGHHIEDFAGLEVFTAAHTMRVDRAYPAEPKQLKELLPKGKYADDEVAYEGAFIRPYAARVYSGGATEMISMGFEHFASPKLLKTFFMKDGHHALTVLGLLQKAPQEGAQSADE